MDGGRAFDAGFHVRPAGDRNRNRERGSHARRFHEGTAGGRRPLRPPDPPLEPEDEALHLHRARRHLHHRPAADPGPAPGGTRLRARDRRTRRLRALRRHEEAGAGRSPRRGAPGRHAVREPSLARRSAHELAHDLRPDPAAPRAPLAQDRVAARPAPGQGAHLDGGRAREARGEPRRCRRHAPPARRGLHRRPAQGAARGSRGATPRVAGDRARRHELRSGRGRVRDPGQRRRDPFVRARDQGDRRRHRRRQAARDAERDGRREAQRPPAAGGGGSGRGSRRGRAEAAAEPAEETTTPSEEESA